MGMTIAYDAEAGEERWQTVLRACHGPEPAIGQPVCGLWDIYGPIAACRHFPYVIAQLGQSLDGRIVTAPDQSPAISGPEGLRHLHRLRALVDAVMVGVGTVVADDPRLTVRLAQGPSPARIVIDPRFRLPERAKLLADDGVPVFAVQSRAGERPPRVQPVVVPATADHAPGSIAPAAIIASLAELGFRRILVEGGAHTVSAFLAAGMIDRLHVTVAPVIIGRGLTGCNLIPANGQHGMIRPQTTIHRLGSDILFDCAFGDIR
jgi:riboflavin-specific deaminase-like protein